MKSFSISNSNTQGVFLRDTLHGDGGVLNFDSVVQWWQTWDPAFAAARAAQGFTVREFPDHTAFQQAARQGELAP